MTTASAVLPPEMRVVATIRGLKAIKGLSTDDVRRHIAMSRSTWFDRMRTGQFTIGEIIALADLFDVSVQSLVDGQLSAPKIARKLRAIAGSGTVPTLNRPLMFDVPGVTADLVPSL